MKVVVPDKAETLSGAVSELYEEVWNNGSIGLLDHMLADGIVYSDVLGYDSDSFGKRGVKQLFVELQATYPLLRYKLVSQFWVLWAD